ncbi:MAG: MarR family transcriptional regulator [Steroidobacteraceae bacterium]
MPREETPFRIGFLIHDVSRLRRTVVDKALRPLGITRSQWWVLANLARDDSTAMTQTELARVMDVGKVTLGGLIDRLESGGLVRRQPDPADRRAKRIVMTQKGSRLLAEIHTVAREVDTSIMAGIAKGDIARTDALLAKMKQQLIAMDAVPGIAGTDSAD